MSRSESLLRGLSRRSRDGRQASQQWQQEARKLLSRTGSRSDYRSFEFEEKVGHPSQNHVNSFRRGHALVHATLDSSVPVSF